jgi:hypothetical protein
MTRKFHLLILISAIVVFLTASVHETRAQPRRKAVPFQQPSIQSLWGTVVMLTPAQQEKGCWWAGGANADRALNDYIAGFRVGFIHIVLNGGDCNKRIFYVDRKSQTEFARMRLDLRGDRTGSRTYRIQIGYRPRKGWNGNGGGGTLSLTYGNTQRIAQASYPTPPYYASGPKAVMTSSPFTIGENDGIDDVSPFIIFTLFGTPTAYQMGGEITFIRLQQKPK